MIPLVLGMKEAVGRTLGLLLFPAVFFSCSASSGGAAVFDVEEVVRSADVVRSGYEAGPTIYLYQGNGRFGSSYGRLGLHLRPDDKDSGHGKTQFMHLLHMGRGKFNADYLMPMAEVYWESKFQNISNYTQRQSFYDGTITTSFDDDGNGIEVTTWFDPVEKDLGFIAFDVSQAGLEVKIDLLETLNLHYGSRVSQNVEVEKRDGQWKVALECLGKRSELYIGTDADVEPTGNVLSLTLKKGHNYIRFSYGAPSGTSVRKSLSQTEDWWHAKWTDSGCIKVTDDKAQKMWVRSMAMFLSSYSDTKEGLSPPMGYSSNGWPFYYPQDVSYIHPILLATGNLNIAKSWIEYWSERVDGLRAYTERLYGVTGLLAPWVFPYGDFAGYHDPTPPNRFYYEIHNSGYFARMACETAEFVNDNEWTARYAVPVIAGCAEFYRNICTKGDDGKWHLYVEPSMGQDERGGMNQKDYLCAMYSAQYCFQQAVKYGVDTDGVCSQILADGLAFDGLKADRGYYYSCAGRGEDDFGKQKHPVQLNELAFLPVNGEASPAAAIAYDLRYDITARASDPYFFGWTLGEFLLAGSRMGQPDQWLRDWDNMERSGYVDPEWIQIYETSRDYDMPFYNITNGLVAQSLLNNLVCDWYGKLELAKCNPWEGKVFVKGVRSMLGVVVDGAMEGRRYDVVLTAWKDTQLELDGETITMKKGERIIRKTL